MVSLSIIPKILIIDDDRGVRESLSALFSNTCDVFSADTIRQGLLLIRQKLPEAVILDIKMPDCDGLEALQQIRQIDPTISVIVLTGYGSIETAQHALRFGANDYLTKPYDLEEIQKVAQREIQQCHFRRRQCQGELEMAEINGRLLKELVEKEHLAAMGQASAELAHDLVSPLTVALGYIQLLAKRLDTHGAAMAEDRQELTSYIDEMERSLQRCCQLVSSWKNLGKRKKLEMKSVSLLNVLQEVTESAKPAAGQELVKLEFVATCYDARVWADPVQLQRALHNVVANAVEAVMKSGGVVRITCQTLGGQGVIRIEDNGPGIEIQHLNRIFEPYFTTKKTNGTGLGLFITQKIIKEHHGTIHVESKLQQGTTFIIRLPLSQRGEVAAATAFVKRVPSAIS